MSESPFGFDDVAGQAWLLLDRARVAAYARAIRAVVRPGDVAVDVGTGSGVLAVLAAQAGARKVYAIERGGVADLASRVFADNGVADRVELVRADARDVRIPEPADVIITETLGVFGIEEDIVALLKLLARQGAPGARLVPHTLRLMVAPLHDAPLAASMAQLDLLEGVRLGQVRRRLGQRAHVRRVPESDVAGPAEPVATIALGRDGLPDAYRARLRIERDAELSALAAWFEAELSPGVVLTNAPGAPKTSWLQLTLPLDPPIAARRGAVLEVELMPRVTGGRSLYRWSAVLRGDGERDGERRDGDVLRSAGGALEDFARQLGMVIAPGERVVGSAQLEAWNALSGGSLRAPFPSIDALAARLHAALPERYADLGDAREEVVALLDACRALK